MAGRSKGVTGLCVFNGAPVVFFKLIMSEKLNQFSTVLGTSLFEVHSWFKE